MNLKPGDKAPAITLPDETGQSVSLADFHGHPIIVYFYPKDDTPGCTTEACGFRDQMNVLKDQGVAIVGISKDSVKSHAKFKEKHGLNFPLLSDESGEVCEAYGVWKEKTMAGRTYMGIERTTFLVNKEGVIAHIWPKVSVGGHVEEVIAEISKAVR